MMIDIALSLIQLSLSAGPCEEKVSYLQKKGGEPWNAG